MEAATKGVYSIGIKLESKEHYDELMKKHSKKGLFSGLDFEGLFDGYPEDGQYPCLVEYYVDVNPTGFQYSMQLREIVDDGFTVILKKDVM